MTNNSTDDKMSSTIPFHGFYESIHSAALEDAIKSYYDFEGTGEPDTMPDDFWLNFKGWHTLELAYVREYVNQFESEFNALTGLDISFEFEEMTSPKEYNFTTDRIFVKVSKSDVLKMLQYVDFFVFSTIIKDRFTSRSGFSSFYSNDIMSSEWLGNALEYDHNQVGTLIEAIITQEGVRDMDYNIYDSIDTFSLLNEISMPEPKQLPQGSLVDIQA